MSIIIKIIEKNYPDCLPIKVVDDDKFDNIVWLKDGNYTKPTKEQIESFIDAETIIQNEIESKRNQDRVISPLTQPEIDKLRELI